MMSWVTKYTLNEMASFIVLFLIITPGGKPRTCPPQCRLLWWGSGGSKDAEGGAEEVRRPLQRPGQTASPKPKAWRCAPPGVGAASCVMRNSNFLLESLKEQLLSPHIVSCTKLDKGPAGEGTEAVISFWPGRMNTGQSFETLSLKTLFFSVGLLWPVSTADLPAHDSWVSE